MGLIREHNRLLYKISRAYYHDDETQGSIADRFGISRVKVSRLLAQAREDGVVTISIRSPSSETVEIERTLADRYKIKEVLVADGDGNDALASVGRAAAAYFKRTITGGETVALGWGSSLYSFVNALETASLPGIKVVQMLGGLGDANADIHGAELARLMGMRLGCKPRILQAPGIVSSPAVRKALLEDAQISEPLLLACKADIAFVGLGSLDSSSLLRGASIISAGELAMLSKAGAIGDLSLRFFDAEGKAVRTPIDERVIGLSLEEIRALPCVVAVVCGSGKTAALRGALGGGLLDVLITDRENALELLE